jgi:hypothetical protein
MKPDSRPVKTTVKQIFIAAVFLFCFSSLSGCITNKVLNLRRDRETRVKETTNFWSLAAVRSAHVIAGSDAFACVEFRDSPGDAPQAYTINLSQAARIGRTVPEFTPAGYGGAGLTWQFYPLQEARKGCESPAPVSALRIETVQIRRADQPRLTEMLFSPDGGKAEEGRLIVVGFAPDDPRAEPSGAGDVLLVYRPPATNADLVQPLGVAGAFEASREWVNPYTLLIAPAVAADTFVLWIIGSAGGDPSRYIDGR